MKYNSIFASILILAAVACQKEGDLKSGVKNDEMTDITVSTDQKDTTKCESHGEKTLFEDMPIVTESGDTLYLSATISDMADPEISQTKSAPITSSTSIPGNKFYLYVGDGSAAYTSVANTSTGTDILMDQRPVTYASSKWSFSETYFWPSSASKELHFVSLGPANLIDDSYIYNLSESGYGWQSDGSFKGRYQSRKDDTVTKNDAVNMFDFVYGYDNQSKNTHSSSVELNLKHACVGVRFIVGDIFGTIGSISFNKFYKNADFTINSSGLTWSNWGSSNSEFKQVYDKFADESTEGQDLDETTGKTKTFMLIPQTLPTNAEMIIDMVNTLHPETLSFDTICAANPGLSKNWVNYQGKIITFRVNSDKANNVSVAFDDTVTGNVKSNLKFENDGKSAIYMRACLVGNWLNENGEVLTSWSETATNIHGTFTSGTGKTYEGYFPNSVPTTLSDADTRGINWIKGADGFYYYKKILLSRSTATQPLFDTFTVESKPADNEGSWNTTGSTAQSMIITNFEMAILVQAVSAVVSKTGVMTKEYAKAAWGDAVENYLTTNQE